MKRLTLFIALGLAVLFAIFASSAAATFTANNKGTEGNALFAFHIENAGSTIYCGSIETSQLSWQIKKEGKASGSGPELALNFASWGGCVVEYKEGSVAKFTGGKCTWEAKETGSEREVTGKIANTCTLNSEIGGKSCQVTIKPESNEKLSTLELADSGKENEHMSVNIELKGVTLSTSGSGCETAGIKSTSTAKLTGAIDAFEVTPGVVVPIFRLFFGGGATPAINALNGTRTVIVSNSGTPAKPEMELANAGPDFGSYEVINKTLAECQGTMIATQGTCTMTVKFIARTPNGGVAYQKFQILGAGGAVIDQMTIIANG
jgi:hypothetical protein